MSEEKVHRIWKHIKIDDGWLNADVSVLEDIEDSWFERRAVLQNNSEEYENFLLRLKREHAIETGVVERMYDLTRGITETLIKEGFVKSYLSHGDTNIPADDLMAHLNDHLDAVDFVFDVVKNNRTITTGFIKELHHLTTRSQQFAEGRDQFGNRTEIPLIKGRYKEQENNPTREDGTKVMYCPPDHTASEMDNLVSIYEDLVSQKVHPLIIAAWFHHAFTTIHPFQDGNGRVARLLTSLIFIKYGYFPFTVQREEAKVKYINALEAADERDNQPLINYIGTVQKRNIEKALNLKEVTSKSLEEVQKILAQKIEDQKRAEDKEIDLREERELAIEESRNEIFGYCEDVLNDLLDSLSESLNGNAEVQLKSSFLGNAIRPNLSIPLHFSDSYNHYVLRYAEKYDYHFNQDLSKVWFTLNLQLSPTKNYELVVSIHHFGFDVSTLAIGAFLLVDRSGSTVNQDSLIWLNIPPHVISVLNNNLESKKKNIKSYLENALTIALAQIASEI